MVFKEEMITVFLYVSIGKKNLYREMHSLVLSMFMELREKRIICCFFPLLNIDNLFCSSQLIAKQASAVKYKQKIKWCDLMLCINIIKSQRNLWIFLGLGSLMAETRVMTISTVLSSQGMRLKWAHVPENPFKWAICKSYFH